ncbi:MAG TPA: hypothetical protein VL333_06125 [Candidatus Saccharimonadales bacterium]|nr:hypothetical protein [Candidatus Saccharimonadales bacterium]
MVIRAPAMPVEELLAYLFPGEQQDLASDARRWLAASRPFRAFAETYRDKIRKKARGARDDQARRDLGFELAVAALLLGDRRLRVEYEPYGVGRRAPDLRVTFRSLRFNVEARRLRGAAGATQLSRTLCDKIGQLPTSMSNLLVLGTETPATAARALGEAASWLEDRAADGDDRLFRTRGFTGARDFLRHYRRLSGILWSDQRGAPAEVLWSNRNARHPLPAELARVLIALGRRDQV